MKDPNSSEENLEAALCVMCMSNTDDTPLACGHMFHPPCLANWSTYIESSCPMCRMERDIDHDMAVGHRIGWEFVCYVNTVHPTLIQQFFRADLHASLFFLRCLRPGHDPSAASLVRVDGGAQRIFLEFVRFVHVHRPDLVAEFVRHASKYGREGQAFRILAEIASAV